MYQPELGRFTARDPMPENGQILFTNLPDGIMTNPPHPYDYADNNPINKTDPSGLQTESPAIAEKPCRCLPAMADKYPRPGLAIAEKPCPPSTSGISDRYVVCQLLAKYLSGSIESCIPPFHPFPIRDPRCENRLLRVWCVQCPKCLCAERSLCAPLVTSYDLPDPDFDFVSCTCIKIA